MASDPLADMQNLMGYAGLVGPNKYTNPAWNDIPYPFGQSAPAGPLGQLPGMAQMNTGVMGNNPPTDAYGNPIKGFVDYSNDQNALYAKQMADYNAKLAAAPPPGQTINSSPAGGIPDNQAMIDFLHQQNAGIQGSPASLNQGGFGAGNGVLSNQALMQIRDNATMADSLKAQAARAGAGGAGAAGSGIGPPPTPTNLSGAYLDALRNPGPIALVGAGPPGPGQTPTGSSQSTPNVMGAFLAANAGSKTPFMNTLRGTPA